MTTTEPTAAGSAWALPAGDALVVDHGEVAVFVTETDPPGPWVAVTQVHGPARLAGADLPGAELLVSAQPGARWHRIARHLAADPVTDVTAAATAARAAAAAAAEDKRRRDALQDAHDAWQVRDALTELADAVPGHHGGTSGDADVAAMQKLSGLLGLPSDPMRLRRAVSDAEVSGRDRMTGLAAACSASVRRLVLPAGWWRSRGPALLVAGEDDRWLVARWARGGYRVWDPATDTETTVGPGAPGANATLGLVLQPLLDAGRPTSLRELVRLSTRGAGRTVAGVLALTLAMALLTAVVPVVSGRLATAVAGTGTPSLAAAGLALVLVIAASAALAAVRLFGLLRVRTQATATAAAAVWDRQLRLPMRWHRQRTQTQRITDATAIDVASAQVSDSVAVALLDSATVAGALLGALFVSPAVAATIAVVLGVRAVLDVRLVRRQTELTQQVIAQRARSPVLELLHGVNRLRASGAIARGYARWAQYQGDTVRLAVRIGQVGTAQQVLAALWPTLGLALLLGVLALTQDGAPSDELLGALVTAQTALIAANGALAAAIASAGAGLSAAAVLRRTRSILAAVPESAGGGEVAPLSGAVDLRGVVYRYAPDVPPILNGVDLAVHPGEHLAVVGPSGCGKTTLLRLLLGLDDPESGLIAFDGRDLTGLDRSAVRRQIGAVMQSSALLPGSILDNVDLGRGLGTAAIWAALEQASVAADVRAMPMGLHTVVVEGGSTVSGGQRQRILLARALAGRPAILVLDEATSALDSVSQAAVVRNLDELVVTRIVVAHRLSTIRRADRIAVIGAGRIVQTGTFADLVARPGPFRDLVQRQSVDPLPQPSR